ncbi:uncharacterized protein LOC131149671 isoform X2 [Malania oleifera]|uniref:uncharacterized protein LOC131149671 isoform X2 n=1 Tax=Malania oleifera TaxID=397392 RepID=UPI0025ADE02F|nr:uncharacterized protein LOC131149671 isoform X2 [Malania oleifera]
MEIDSAKEKEQQKQSCWLSVTPAKQIPAKRRRTPVEKQRKPHLSREMEFDNGEDKELQKQGSWVPVSPAKPAPMARQQASVGKQRRHHLGLSIPAGNSQENAPSVMPVSFYSLPSTVENRDSCNWDAALAKGGKKRSSNGETVRRKFLSSLNSNSHVCPCKGFSFSNFNVGESREGCLKAALDRKQETLSPNGAFTCSGFNCCRDLGHDTPILQQGLEETEDTETCKCEDLPDSRNSDASLQNWAAAELGDLDNIPFMTLLGLQHAATPPDVAFTSTPAKGTDDGKNLNPLHSQKGSSQHQSKHTQHNVLPAQENNTNCPYSQIPNCI